MHELNRRILQCSALHIPTLHRSCIVQHMTLKQFYNNIISVVLLLSLDRTLVKCRNLSRRRSRVCCAKWYWNENVTSAESQYTVEAAGGSGYKSLRVLNNTAAMYVHKTRIKKWDVCAGDAIMRAAGGHMLTLKVRFYVTLRTLTDFINTGQRVELLLRRRCSQRRWSLCCSA